MGKTCRYRFLKTLWGSLLLAYSSNHEQWNPSKANTGAKEIDEIFKISFFGPNRRGYKKIVFLFNR